jgi:hypothetical protein
MVVMNPKCYKSAIRERKWGLPVQKQQLSRWQARELLS